MPGGSATSFCGPTAARCTAAIPATLPPGASCTAPRSRAKPGRWLEMSTGDPAEDAVLIDAAAPPRSAWNSVPNQVLLLLCLMYMLFYVDRVNISTAAPLIKSDLGLSNTALGFVFSAFAYPYALFQLIGGWLRDKFGPPLTLGGSGVVLSPSPALSRPAPLP